MAKIISDRSGDLRKGVFYVFKVMYDDDVLFGEPTPEWIITPRTPTNDALLDADHPSYLALEDYPQEEDLVETKDCSTNPNHRTLRYYKSLRADLVGGTRLAPFGNRSRPGE